MASNGLDIETSVKFRHFNWEKAKTLYYVTKLGSFTKAGAFLRVTQSALSRHIIDLEQNLGTPLFIRQARGVKLTRKGQELYTIVEAAFLGINGFTNNIHAESNQGKRRTIRIATTHAITAYILDTHIINYNKEHPNLVFELISDDHMIDIVMNDVDIAIRPFDPDARGVQQELLFTLEKRLYASRDYLKQYGEPKTVDDLKHHRIIAPAHTDDFPYAKLNWILKLGKVKSEMHQPVFTSTSIESLVKAAKNNIGIIGSYEQMEIINDSDLVNILPDVKDEKIKEYLIYPDHLKNDKDINNLKNYLQTNIFSTISK